VQQHGVQQRLGAPVLGLRTCAPRASPHFALSQFLQYNKFRKVLEKLSFINSRGNLKMQKLRQSLRRTQKVA
jgi:hypothetical protein